MSKLNNKALNLIKEIKDAPKLTDEAIFEGAQLCIDNAKGLHKLAKIAFRNKLHSYSASISIIAMEELAKVQALRSCFINTSPFDWYSLVSLFSGKKSHKQKLLTFIGGMDWYEDDIDNIIAKYSLNVQKAGTLQSLKEQGLYVDMNKKNKKLYKNEISKITATKLIKDFEKVLNLEETTQKMGLDFWKEYRRESTPHLKYIEAIIHQKIEKIRNKK